MDAGEAVAGDRREVGAGVAAVETGHEAMERREEAHGSIPRWRLELPKGFPERPCEFGDEDGVSGEPLDLGHEVHVHSEEPEFAGDPRPVRVRGDGCRQGLPSLREPGRWTRVDGVAASAEDRDRAGFGRHGSSGEGGDDLDADPSDPGGANLAVPERRRIYPEVLFADRIAKISAAPYIALRHLQISL